MLELVELGPKAQRLVGIAITSAVLLCQAAGAASSGRTFTLYNQSDVEIKSVHAGPDYVSDWGENLLGDSTLPARSERLFHVSAEAGQCMFDIRAMASNGFKRSFMGVDLCNEDRFVFSGVHILLIDNKSETTISRVLVYSAGGDVKLENALESGAVISAGDKHHVMVDGRGRHCTFNISFDATATTGSEDPFYIVTYFDRDLCDDPEIVFYEGNELFIVNEGQVATRGEFIISIDGEALQSIGMGSSGRPGSAQVVRVHPLDRDQCVFDFHIYDIDHEEHTYEGLDICKNDRLIFPPPRGGGDRPAAQDVRVDLAVGKTFRDCEDWGCPWMVVVDGGEYERGSWEQDEEAPVKKVAVPGPFAVGEFEVTVAQFEEFARETGRERERGCLIKRGSRWRWDDAMDWHSPGFEQGDSHPVVCVSWDDATAYAEWLAERTGLPYRLLTEAEWELLARTSAMNFERSGKANCRGCGSKWDGKSTAPAGRFGSDRRGVSDLFGNAAEWVQDCYQSGYSNAPRDGSAWLPPSCERRVLRGGSFFSRAAKLRASGRDHAGAERRNSSVGFRVAR